MSDQLFIFLQGLLAFGAPLTLAVIELRKLRRRTPAPLGGGEPSIVAFSPRPRPAVAQAALPANQDAEIARAA